MRILAAFRASKRSPILQLAKSAVAIALSWIAASALLGVPAPIFAAIAALLVVAPSVNQSFVKGIERTIGVIIGVVIASVIGAIAGAAGWVVLVAIAIALFVAWLIKATATTSNQVAISAMLVLALGGTTQEYAIDRILETLIGAIIGVAVNAFIIPPIMLEPARQSIALLGGELAASLVRLADVLEAPSAPGEREGLMIQARLLRPMSDAAFSAIEEAAESLKFTPWRSRARTELTEMRELLQRRLAPIATQTLGMTRALTERYEPSLPEEPAAIAIAEQLRRAAHDVRLAVHLAEVDPAPMTSAIPALTAPLDVRAPRSGNWVLIGSIMEDLRRIRGELLDEA